jgi:hypothetical protein
LEFLKPFFGISEQHATAALIPETLSTTKASTLPDRIGTDLPDGFGTCKESAG